MRLIDRIIRGISSFGRKSADKDYRQPVGYFGSLGTQDINSIPKSEYIKYLRSWVYACVSTIGLDFATLNFWLYKDVARMGKTVNHPYLKFLTFSLLYNLWLSLEVYGKWYLWLNKVWNNVLWLKLLHPAKVSKIFNGTDYRYEFYDNWVVYRYAKEEIIDFDTSVLWLSKLEALWYTLSLDMSANVWNIKYFDNGAHPSGVVEVETTPTQDTMDMIKRNWNENYGWKNNAHKTAFLVWGAKYNPIQLSHKDMDYSEQKRLSKDEIFGVFKVPPAIIGNWSSDNLNIGTYENIYARRTIQPIAVMVAEKLNETLFKWIWYFQFLNIVPTDKIQLRNDFNSWAITVNEYREAIWYSAIEWWDMLKTPIIWAMPNNWTNPDKVDEQKNMWFMHVTMKAVWVDNDTIDDNAIWNKSFKSIVSKAVTKAVKENIPGTEEYYEKQWSEKIARNDWYETNYRNKLIQIFDEQRKDVIKAFKEWKKNVIKDAWKTTKYIALYLSLLDEEQKRLLQKEGNVALLQVNSTDIFDISKPNIIKRMKENIKKFWKSIDEATQDKLAEVLASINEEWLGVEEWLVSINGVFDELDTVRMAKIIRTETIRASWYAQVGAWKQSGVVERKQRYTALDERTCPQCNSQHGRIVELEGNFFNKWDKHEVDWTIFKYDYDNIANPPLHPNCRCSMVPLIS